MIALFPTPRHRRRIKLAAAGMLAAACAAIPAVSAMAGGGNLGPTPPLTTVIRDGPTITVIGDDGGNHVSIFLADVDFDAGQAGEIRVSVPTSERIQDPGPGQNGQQVTRIVVSLNGGSDELSTSSVPPVEADLGAGNDAVLDIYASTLRLGPGADRARLGLVEGPAFAGAGDDRLIEVESTRPLFAGPGSDTVVGGETRDRFNGGTGKDKLFGRLHGDVLNGGRGHDLCNGGGNYDPNLGGTAKDRGIACEIEKNIP